LTRILNAEPLGYSEEARKIIVSLGKLHEKALSRSELIRVIKKYDILITRFGFKIDRDVLDAATSLKFIVTPTTGLDHIDMEYARKKGIEVISLQGETEFLRTVVATAEHTWALLLALIRRVPWAFQSVLKGEWKRDSFRGNELEGKRLGILGLGRLGEKVAFYGIAFGMKVMAYDPYRQTWPDGIRRCFNLRELLSRSDIFSIHLPLNNETKGLIGRKELKTLPKGAIVINASRGPVLDSLALAGLLSSGHLGGAALDVLEGEGKDFKRQRQNRLLLAYARKNENLLITPHLGGATKESMAKTEIFIANKLKKHLDSLR
jgi:D-3-phosphoglycerate dehydrogenase